MNRDDPQPARSAAGSWSAVGFPCGRMVSAAAGCCWGLLWSVAMPAAAQPGPPDERAARVGVTPDPSDGRVAESGKFVPAHPSTEHPATPATPGEWKDRAAELIEITGEHTFRVGMIHGDRSAKSITMPAEVNARDGVIEYAMVTRGGKVHESLLSTAADPLHVQVAALLLGMASHEAGATPAKVEILVEWETNGPARSVALEDLVALAEDTPANPAGGTLARGSWRFTGSRIDAHGFVAAREGSIIALIEDPAALIGNPRPERHNDRMHVPNTAELPAAGMPVAVRIVLMADVLETDRNPSGEHGDADAAEPPRDVVEGDGVANDH